MKACRSCGEEKPCEPYSGLCVDCLAAKAREGKPAEPEPFDARRAQTGERE